VIECGEGWVIVVVLTMVAIAEAMVVVMAVVVTCIARVVGERCRGGFKVRREYEWEDVPPIPCTLQLHRRVLD